MSNDTPNNESTQQPSHTAMEFSYAAQSRMVLEGEMPKLALFSDLKRDPVFFDGVVKDPIRLREALGALYAIVGSDYRYAPKDRTAYHAYRRMRAESANLNAWQAQHAYFDWLARNDPMAFLILDPVITVHPDQLLFEVFSKDEGTYANLSIDIDAFDLDETPIYGTTNIDFSRALYDNIQQFRSYRKTRVTIGQQAVAIGSEGTPPVLEKQIQIPDSWLRGFLQVQSATTLTTDKFSLAPIDLYNILRHLRMNADQKGKRRGLRIELIPGEKPKVVLEPWETVLELSAGVYEGTQPKVVRVWGRRRLMLLRRVLSFVESVDVYLLGTGLPSFWVLKAHGMTFTVGMTGFTSSNWSQGINFDLLLPRQTQDSKPLAKVMKLLAKQWSSSEEAISKSVKLSGEELKEPLQLGCQQGQLMYDMASQTYRLRPLTNVPVEMDRLEYRNLQERLAYDLIQRKDAVSITSENRIYGAGIELTGNTVVKEDKREYRPQLLVSDEGHVSRADCTCSQFRKHGLQEGPCTHLIALRLAHAIREKQRRESGGDPNITVETKTYSKREQGIESVYQLALDRKRLRIRWGRNGTKMRVQQIQFASVSDARQEYLSRVNRLIAKGFLDASGG